MSEGRALSRLKDFLCLTQVFFHIWDVQLTAGVAVGILKVSWLDAVVSRFFRLTEIQDVLNLLHWKIIMLMLVCVNTFPVISVHFPVDSYHFIACPCSRRQNKSQNRFSKTKDINENIWNYVNNTNLLGCHFVVCEKLWIKKSNQPTLDTI